jgi:hypothetical protein
VTTLTDLQIIVEAIRLGNYRLTLHASARMNQRKMTHADLKSIVNSITVGAMQNDGSYLVIGYRENGKGAGFAAKIEDAVVVITVFPRKLSRKERVYK